MQVEPVRDALADGFGGYGSTQSTVLALKAMAAYAKDSRRTQASGTVTLVVNGAPAGKLVRSANRTSRSR